MKGREATISTQILLARKTDLGLLTLDPNKAFGLI